MALGPHRLGAGHQTVPHGSAAAERLTARTGTVRHASARHVVTTAVTAGLRAAPTSASCVGPCGVQPCATGVRLQLRIRAQDRLLRSRVCMRLD